MTVRTIRLGSLALVVGVVSSCAAAASVSQAPHWIDMLPLSDPFREVHVADAAFLGNETISDGIAWSCTLVPEGDPAVDKASEYAERFRRIATLSAAVPKPPFYLAEFGYCNEFRRLRQ